MLVMLTRLGVVLRGMVLQFTIGCLLYQVYQQNGESINWF